MSARAAAELAFDRTGGQDRPTILEEEPVSDVTGTWVPITCEERERLVHGDQKLTVLSSITDPNGEYGTPRIFTEWGYQDETPVLRDNRWPGRDWPSGPDERPCEHYRFTPAVCAVVRDHGGHAHPCGQAPGCPAGPGDCCAHCRYETATREEA